jgi:4-hydroxy-tetrahydrodipicolinate synthase
VIDLKPTGIYVPNVTPFNAKGEIMYDKLGELLEFWIDGGISGVIANASTGEAPYLSRDERVKIIEYLIEKADGRINVFAGTGATSLWQSIELTRDALNVGAQAALVTTPFFFKPTGDEIAQYFIELMDAVDIPVILYNVPKFTGYSVAPKVVAKVADACSNLVAMKDSSNNPGNMADVISLCGDKINALSGAADMILPTLMLGGKGAIVAIGNVAPRTCVNIFDAYGKSNVKAAGDNQLRASFVNKVVVRDYPQIPAIKAALNQMGLPAGHPRKPLTALPEETARKIKETLGL